jgi:hypothetical protein
MASVRQALFIGATIGVIAGAGAATVYYRDVPRAPASAPSALALRSKLRGRRL